MTIFSPRYFSISFSASLNDGEGGQAQEIHLQQAELFEAHHVVLRHNFLLVGDVERHQLAQRHRRNDHTGRMHAGIAADAFQLHADIEHFFDARLFRGDRPSVRGSSMALLKLDVQLPRNQLGDAVDLRKAHVEHAAHIFDGGFRGERAEGDDLRYLLAAVFSVTY